MEDAIDRVKGKLVYAEDVLDLFYVASAGQDKTFVNVVEQVIQDTPTADVVEVVRCEKCKYLKHTRGHIPYCKRMDEYADGDILYEVSYDDFCSYGERIDNNG